MIKAARSETSPPDSMDTEKKPVCWSKDGQAHSLRVELNSGGFFIFPYTHLTFAKLERQGDSDSLIISFTTHDLHITGTNLRELGVALQKLSVDWIRQAPSRYAALVSKDTVYIEDIEIKEASVQVPM